MMSDLLASDNINLHNRVGKRDHAHATLAPPQHESQRTRDQRKGPPLPKATSHPDRRKAQRAGRGPATSKPAREPHTVTTAPTNNQQFTARGGRGVQCTKSWRRERRTVPPGRRGARQYGPSPHAHAPSRRARSSQRHTRAGPRRAARRLAGQKASSACEATPAESYTP